MTLNMSAIYDEFFSQAIMVARPYVKDLAAAKDVAQESMIKVWKKQHLFDETKSSLRTWIWRIAKHTAIDKHRADTLSKLLVREDESGWTYFECPCIDLDTLDLQLNLNKLETKYRVPLYLNFIEGYTAEKISEMTGVPLGTVKGRIKIGLRELRKIYV